MSEFWKSVAELAARREQIPWERREMSAVRELMLVNVDPETRPARCEAASSEGASQRSEADREGT